MRPFLLKVFALQLLFNNLIGTGTSATLAGAPGVTATVLTFQGVTEPYRQATISASFASSVTEIFKKEGASAKKGDTILKLDYAETFLDAERCRVIAESEAELEAVKLKAKTAEQDYLATKILHDSTSAISGEELWKKELEYNLARTERDRLTMVKAKELIEYKMAQDRLRHFFVIAPFSGIIAQTYLHESEACKPQEPLVRLVDVQKCRFITYIPGVLSQDMTKGKQVSVSLEGSKAPVSKDGYIEFISPVVDQSSGLRTVKIVFDNADCSIQPGVKGSLLLRK